MNKIEKRIEDFLNPKPVSKLWQFIKGFTTPGAMTWDGWRDWKKEVKAKYPIRYWLFRTLPHLYRVHIEMRLDDWKYWVRHRTTDKFHIIETGLKPGYYDYDKRMLHGCFHLLTEYVDEMDMTNNWDSYLRDDEYDPEGKWKKVHTEVKELYEWWTIERPNRPDLDKLLPSLDKEGRDEDWFMSDSRRDDPQWLEYCRVSEENSVIEEKWKDEDTQMLFRLVSIRKHLWW
jgi:hypothetical protein